MNSRIITKNMHLIQKKGFVQNRFQSRLDSRVQYDNRRVKIKSYHEKRFNTNLYNFSRNVPNFMANLGAGSGSIDLVTSSRVFFDFFFCFFEFLCSWSRSMRLSTSAARIAARFSSSRFLLTSIRRAFSAFNFSSSVF